MALSDYYKFPLDEAESKEFQQPPVNKWNALLLSKGFRFTLLLVGCAFIGVVMPVIWTNLWRESDDYTIESDLRYDCSPLRPNSTVLKSSCEDVCIWDEYAKFNEIVCYYRLEVDSDVSDHHSIMPSYLVEHETDAYNYDLKIMKSAPFLNASNAEIKEAPIVETHLSVSISHYSENHFRVLIKPKNEDDRLWSKFYDYNYPNVNNKVDSEAIVTVRNNVEPDLFQLKVRRKSTLKSIFNMGIHSPFIYSVGHIEITTLLINDLVYGFGQSNQRSFRHNFTYPKSWLLFNQYNNNITENVTAMFGSNPFYLGIDDTENGDAYGVLLLNPFPIFATTNARPSLTLQVLGGHLEFHFFLGPRPDDVIKQLQGFIYKPAMPPYWALGFHMCETRCGLPDLNKTLSKLTEMGIPIESNCGSAIDFDNRDDQLNQFKEYLKRRDMKLLSVVLPQQTDKMSGYSLTESGVPYVGTVAKCQNKKPEPTFIYYPDFFNSEIVKKYKTLLLDNADGYILDQNTPLNLLNGNESCAKILENYPWNRYFFAKINVENPCMDLQFSQNILKQDSTSLTLFKSYLALHNMYGYKHMQTVNKVLGSKRPLIMSLSTFIGSGRYGGHIATPINGTWDMLRFTLKQTLDFSLFGVPLTGIPVGGFRGEPSDELLRRWYQLAAMQPFMIAYSDFKMKNSALVDNINEMIRTAVKTRYQILPYLYTLFYDAHQTGSLVVKPLFFEFFTDKTTYGIESQYMLGSALLVAPVLKESQTSIMAYFPEGRWYDFYSGQLTSKQNGGNIEVPSVDQHINLYLRGGHTIITQMPGMSIKESRKNGLEIVAAYDEMRQSTGRLFVDDGYSPIENSQNLLVHFNVYYTNLTINVEQFGLFCRSQEIESLNKISTTISTIKLYGVVDEPQIPFQLYQGDKLIATITDKQIKFDDTYGVLDISLRELDLCKSNNYFIEWKFPDWQ